MDTLGGRYPMGKPSASLYEMFGQLKNVSDSAHSIPTSERCDGRGFQMLFDDPVSVVFEAY